MIEKTNEQTIEIEEALTELGTVKEDTKGGPGTNLYDGNFGFYF